MTEIGAAKFTQANIDNVSIEISDIKSGNDKDWEFMFYGIAVARTTMMSLLRLYNVGGSTKENFFQNIIFSQTSTNPTAEKEAQFSVLLNYNFIELEGELYKVNNKGKKLLQYHNLIPSN